VSPSDWIALAAVLSTATVAVSAQWSASRTAKSNRENIERRERATRHYAARLDAYREATRLLERNRVTVGRTYPIFTVGPPDPPPPALDENEYHALVARIAVASSEAVVAEVETANAAIREFYGYAWSYGRIFAQGPASNQAVEAHRAVQEAREAAYAAIDGAERMMREELRAL
jgi:hypothetical protein